MTTAKVIAVSLGLFALFLPAGWLIHRDYVQPPRPPGDAVELLLSFHHDKPDHYVARSLVFRAANFPDTSRISIYENLTPLPRTNFRFTEDAGAYVIRIKTQDGSDPRTNGRQYWAVSGHDG
jgi:hypothetical protein